MKRIDTEALTGLPLLDLIASTPVPSAADPAPVRPIPTGKRRRIGSKLPALIAEYRASHSADECWHYPGQIDPGSMGYGRVMQGDKYDYAHRATYIHVNGPIPDGQIVRHTCDCPDCFNPGHLVSGIPADNVADMVERNRQRRTLRKPEALRIDKMLKDGITIPTIAKAFGVAERSIRNIEKGVTWGNDTGRVCTWPSRAKVEKAPRRRKAETTIEARV